MKSTTVNCFIGSILLSTLSLIPATSSANKSPSFINTDMQGLTLTLSGGMAIAPRAGTSHTFFIDNSDYRFKADHDTKVNGLFGIFVGKLFSITPVWSIQSGLSYYFVPISPKGVLTQGVDPESSDQFNYHYHVQSHQLLLDSKLIMNLCHCYHPYLSVGLGAAINESDHYKVNNHSFLTISPQFSQQTKTSFSYNVGIGSDVDIYPHIRLGAGYRFADLGKTKLGKGHINTVPLTGSLSQHHLYNHELLVQLTYIL